MRAICSDKASVSHSFSMRDGLCLKQLPIPLNSALFEGTAIFMQMSNDVMHQPSMGVQTVEHMSTFAPTTNHRFNRCQCERI